MPSDYSMAKTENAVLLGTLAAASVLLGAGLVTPLMTISTFVFMRNSFSVVSGIYDLWISGKYFLFFLILLFSIALPVVKIGLLAAFLTGRFRNGGKSLRVLRLIHDYGRWAMLDVLVVAVLIVTVKLGAVASVEVHPGLYVFGSAVLLIMIVTDRVSKLAERRRR